MESEELELCRRAVEGLLRRGFEAKYVATAAEAAEIAFAEAADAESVGWGGSETVKQLGLRDRFAATGKKILDHRADCDVFYLSANALTEDGRIVNIDGTGNRVAASIFGPRRVVFVIGKNKIVDGGVDDAIARIRREACPPNARRLGRKTPCALTGVCADCDSPDRMCKVTTVMDRRPSGTSAMVIVIGERLGY